MATTRGDLVQRGYSVLKNALAPAQIEEARATIVDKRVDYRKLEQFIEGQLLPVFARQLEFPDIRYTKYRMSDSGNSSDAGCFHRDIIPQIAQSRYSADPIYTCLAYLDKASMRVIPGSHARLEVAASAVPALFDSANAVDVDMVPGDIMIFHSTLLHRGYFLGPQPEHRRLLQIFEVYANRADELQFSNTIVHMPKTTDDCGGSVMALCMAWR